MLSLFSYAWCMLDIIFGETPVDLVWTGIGSLSFLLMSCGSISALSCVRQCIFGGFAGSLPLCGLFSSPKVCVASRAAGSLQSMGLRRAAAATWPGAVAFPGPQSTGASGHGAWVRCTVACVGLPDPGWNLCLLHWPVDSLPLGHGEVPKVTSL